MKQLTAHAPESHPAAGSTGFAAMLFVVGLLVVLVVGGSLLAETVTWAAQSLNELMAEAAQRMRIPGGY